MFGRGDTDPPFPDRDQKPIDPSVVSMGLTMKQAMEQFPQEHNVQSIAHSWNVPKLTQDVNAAIDILQPGVEFTCGHYDETYWAAIAGREPSEATNIATAICLAHVEYLIAALEYQNDELETED